MHSFFLIIIISFFSFSCQTSSQDKENKDAFALMENNDNLKVDVKEELNYYADSADITIYEKILNYANINKLENKSLPEIEIEIAKQFIGTPYVGRTLEKDSIETLVLNLRELDCTTFLENVLAISLCIKNKKIKYNDYCEMLVKIRYRNGQIDGYPSRLHYTTDWLLDNQQKGIIKIVSEEFGPSNFDKKVNFMSTHPENYKQLKNQAFLETMTMHELRISLSKLKFIPKTKINEFAKNIKDGDIIAISTKIPGLDFSHVVIAAWHNNQLYFYHASLKEKKVVLSDKPLQDYLAGIKSNDGIVVARLN
jgi:hypothetical protein